MTATPAVPGMRWLTNNLSLAFPLTDADDAPDKTLRLWTAEDFRNCDYLPRTADIATMMDKSRARTLGDMYGREGLDA